MGIPPMKTRNEVNHEGTKREKQRAQIGNKYLNHG